MNVLFLSHESLLYGAPRSLLLFMRDFVLDHRAHLITIGNGELVERARAAGIGATVLPARTPSRTGSGRKVLTWPGRQAAKIRDALRVAWLARRLRVDLVYANSVSKLTLIFGGRLSGRPVVVHAREVDNFLSARSRLRNWLIRKALDSAQLIICVSQASRRAVEQTGTRTRCRVIHNGIDPAYGHSEPALRERVREDLGIQPNEILIGFVGRLSYRKGYDVFCRVAQGLQSEPGVRFLAVGGHDEETVEGPMDQASPVVRLGFLPDPKPFIDALDIFVMASRQEPFARTNLEAAACGKAVVATAIDGNVEIFKHGRDALLVSPGNVEELESALRTLVRSPQERARLSEAARERSRDFELRNTHVAIEEELKDLLEAA